MALISPFDVPSPDPVRIGAYSMVSTGDDPGACDGEGFGPQYLKVPSPLATSSPWESRTSASQKQVDLPPPVTRASVTRRPNPGRVKLTETPMETTESVKFRFDMAARAIVTSSKVMMTPPCMAPWMLLSSGRCSITVRAVPASG